MTFKLTDEQEFCLEEIIEWALTPTDESNYIGLLNAGAGCGKSTILTQLQEKFFETMHMMSHVIDDLPKSAGNIVFTATQNSPLAGLYEKLPADASFTPYAHRTIYSLLGLRVTEDYKTGDVKIKSTLADDELQDGSRFWFNAGIIVIDEASYIDETLWENIKLQWEIAAAQLGIDNTPKILMVGDKFQLKAVNSDFSVFSLEGFEFNLLTNMRAVHPNMKLFAQLLRDWVAQGKTGNDVPTVPETPGVIEVMEDEEWVDQIKKAIAAKDDFKILSYTNAQVRKANDFVRSLQGKTEHYLKGEELRVNQAISPTDHLDRISVLAELTTRGNAKIPANTSLIIDKKIDLWKGTAYKDKFSVKAKGSSTVKFGLNLLHELFDPYGGLYWLTAKNPKKGREHFFFVAKKPERLKTVLNKLAKEKKWKEYFLVKSCVVDVAYTHAMTVHKAQGVSVDTVFVDTANYLQSVRTLDTLRRMLYVACTRAIYKIYMRGHLS